MEKLIIKSVTDTTKKYKDKKTGEEKSIFSVELADGRKCSAFDPAFLQLPVDKEVELDLVEGKEYNGVKQYIVNIPKPQTGKFPQKDWTFTKRDRAMEHALHAITLTGKEVTSKNIFALADEILNWFNK